MTTKQWQYLKERLENKTLAHGILLAGPQGTGKNLFINNFVNLMLCEAQSHCQQCRSCQLINSGSHPDIMIIKPEEGAKLIKVDQLRKIEKFFHHKPQQADKKICVISPAEAMNLAAANALLKTLEEPNDNCFLFLVSHHPMQLPTTVRSRCQTLYFSDEAIEESNSKEMAELTKDLYALLSNTNDPIEKANDWAQHDSELVISLLQRISIQLVRGDSSDNLQEMRKLLNLSKIFNYYDALVEIRRNLLGKINFNNQLLFEKLFLLWQRNRMIV